jgi:Cdc6-like AAA superfamily ATPase
MSAHIVLLFEPPRASKQTELSVADELERAGYEVVEAHSLSMAAALLFVSPGLEAVVIDAAGDQIAAKLADSVSAIRPGLPLLRAASTKAQVDGQAVHERAEVVSTLDGLLKSSC